MRSSASACFAGRRQKRRRHLNVGRRLDRRSKTEARTSRMRAARSGSGDPLSLPGQGERTERSHRRLAGPADDGLSRLGLWAVLPAPAQRPGLWLQSQARLSDLPRAGVEPADQAEEAPAAQASGALGNGRGHDPGRRARPARRRTQLFQQLLRHLERRRTRRGRNRSAARLLTRQPPCGSSKRCPADSHCATTHCCPPCTVTCRPRWVARMMHAPHSDAQRRLQATHATVR
jgi:hypothetical protein